MDPSKVSPETIAAQALGWIEQRTRAITPPAYFTPSRTPISRDRGQRFTARRTPFHADRGQRFSVMADSGNARG
jgi:hypothetical protein